MLNKIVLFDIDKTLLMGSKVHFNALLRAVSEVYGIITPGKIKNLQGMTDLKIIYTILSMENIEMDTIRSGLNECMELMYLYFNESLQKEDLIVLNGVKDLLIDLQRHEIPTGLVTGNIASIAWLKLN